MKKYLALAAGMVLLSSTQASAAQYSFSFTTTSAFFGPDQNGSGIFTTSDTSTTVEGRTAFAITGISGQINNVAITGLTPESVSLIPTYYYFTEGPTFLNGTGVRFDADPFKGISFFAQDLTADPYRIRGNGTILAFVDASSDAIPGVPEPATWAMMLVGFGVVAGVARRDRRRTAARLG